MQMEWVHDWRGMKGIEKMGGKTQQLETRTGFVNGPLFCGLGILKEHSAVLLRPDNQSHPQETLHISWNQMVKFLCSQDTNTGRHLERVT